MKRRFLEDCLARGMSLEGIGEEVGRHPSTVAYWLKKHGLRANGAAAHRNRSGLDREMLLDLVESGATLREIAEKVDRSIGTVRYWLDRFGLATGNGPGPRGRTRGAKTERFQCNRHGTTDFRLEGRGTYRCLRCRAEAVAQRRRDVKQRLLEDAGGACVICGYERCPGALHFHHVDPASKEFHVGESGHSRSLARCLAEIQKCVLLCANCHAEVEAGFATLPVNSSRSTTAEASLGD